MLDMMVRRAERAGVAARIQIHKCEQNRLGIDAKVDFVLAFAMLHEVPDQDRLLKEVHDCLKPEGRLLLAEPPLHVSGKKFEKEVDIAEAVGFRLVERPRSRWSRAALLGKADSRNRSKGNG
jgi:SAM-dependent methyltransferase